MRIQRYRQNMLRNIKLVNKDQSSNPDRSQERFIIQNIFLDGINVS